MSFASRIEHVLSQEWESRHSESLDDRVRFLGKVILESARDHVGETTVKPTRKPWMTPVIREAIKGRNALGRNIGTHREQWLEACRRVKELIAKEKERRWHSFVAKLEGSSDPARVWRVIRSLGGSKGASGKNEVLVHERREYSTGVRKANVFCKHYAAISRLSLSREEREWSRGVRRRLRNLGPETDDLPECQPFSEVELRRALQQMRGKAAEGEDGISPSFLKHLGERGMGCLLEVLNESWETGYCPQSWRTAVIVPLLKSGKPASEIESHRPVSLTSCVVKTLERMIAARIQHLAEERGWWAEEQAGFRRRRCCEDQVLRLSQSISDGFQSVPSQRTALALLGYSKAYDKVWREALLDKLISIGLPRRYTVWLAGFFRNRLASVRVAGRRGRRILFRQGLPQGSVLSPLLFLFFVNDVKSVVPERVFVSLYADDVAVWSQDRNKGRALEKVVGAVGAIARWSASRHLQLSESKCTLSFFSQHPGEANWRPEAEVEGIRLRFEPNPVFLGIAFDRVLSFRNHAELVAARAGSRSRVLSALAGSDWGWRRESLVRTFLAFVRSIIDYCAAGWQPWLTRSGMDVLTRAQNRALRIVTGQCRTTPVDALTLEAGIPQYRTTAHRLWLGAAEKAWRLPAGHPRRLAVEGSIPHRMKRNSSWRRESARLADELGLEPDSRVPFGPPTTAPWSWSGWLECRIATDLGEEGVSASADMMSAAAEAVLRWQGSAVIFTDGSLHLEASVGGSAAVLLSGPQGDIPVVDGLAVCLIGAASSMEVEVRALSLAVELLPLLPESRVVLCSDSRSAIDALRLPTDGENPQVSQLRRGLLLAGKELILQWVPGHCGLPGNEVADRVAEAAASVGLDGNGAVAFGEVADDGARLGVGGSELWSEAGAERNAGDATSVVADVVAPVDVWDVAWRGRVRFRGAERVGCSYVSVMNRIRRQVLDPAPEHARVCAVYGSGPAVGSGGVVHRAARALDGSRLTRADGVLLAQLRSGHCPALAAYRALCSPGFDGTCPLCLQAPQTLEHWLTDCVARASTRLRFFGVVDPPLSVLTTSPGAAVAYARATLLRS